MTSHFVRDRRFAALALGFLCGGLLLAAGCGDDDTTTELLLTGPKPDAVLTMAHDDQDPERPGLQFDIVGASTGLPEGTTVDLHIDHSTDSHHPKVDKDGAVHVPGVTLPPGKHHIYLETSTGSTGSDPQQAFTVRTLLISAPQDAAVLTLQSDEDKAQDGIQITALVDAYALAADEEVSLQLDGKVVAAEKTDAMGQAAGEAVFRGVTLDFGEHSLLAFAGQDGARIESEEIRFEVDEECAAVSFVSPALPDAGDKLTLGGSDCPDKTIEPFTTRVVISTDAGDGQLAQLFVNDHLVASKLVSGGGATFEDVALTNKHDARNTIAVSVENAKGVTCRKRFPADVFIDCAGASCSLASPTPASYVDAAGDLTLFLNRALLGAGDTGFDVAVESDKDVAGQTIQLVLDGHADAALEAKATEDGDVSSASFPAVDLAEGKHTIEALCTDTHGNVTSSSEFSWVVDVTACGVDIEDPIEDATYVSADDTESSKAGVQVVVTSKVEGDDCSAQRAAVCSPKAGIKDAKSRAYDGKSPLASTVTLDDGSSQTLCIEIEDRAGNVGRDDVAVNFRDAAPRVRVESPSDETKINADGGNGFAKDADRSSANTCDAEFAVACSELGAPVQIYLSDADGDPDGDAIGSADCKKPKSGDAALPAGYNGRATLTVALEHRDSTLIALQSVSGGASGDLTGKSAVLTLHADCRPPQASFSNDPCAAAASHQLSPAQASARDVQVAVASDDAVVATLTFSNDDGTTGTSGPDVFHSDAAEFNDIDLGGGGDSSSAVELTVTVSDDFKNTTELACTATIFSDLPAFDSFSSPDKGDVFGVGALAGCDTGMDGVFGVHVVAKADQQDDRSLSVLVNGDEVDVDHELGSDGAIDVCIPVPDDTETDDGETTLTVHVESTLGGGFAETERTIHVHQLALNAMDDDVFVAADNCAVSGFGYQVMVDVDPTLDGTSYTLGNGTDEITGVISGSMLSACLPLIDGPNTIALSIAGTEISYQADVTVVRVLPPAIVINAQPTPDPLDTDYRKGAHAAWTKPTASFAGQFLAYHMRCQGSALAMGGNGAAWWFAATDVAIPNKLTPSTNTPAMQVPHRPEERWHCVVRLEDVAHQLSPIVQSTNMTLKFRQAVLSTGASAVWVGNSVAAAGDVDGDDIDDLLVGGMGYAELIFGTDQGPATATKLVFVGGGNVGYTVSGIGDINEDGLDDFAVGDPSASVAGPGTYGGRVSIFLGRDKADWPAGEQNIDTACNADLCLAGGGNAFLGSNLAPAGDFDGDQQPDLAIGSAYSPDVLGSVFPGQLLVLLGGCTRSGLCDLDPPSGSFFEYSASMPTGDWVDAPSGTPPARLSGFRLDGSGALADGRLGILVAGVGAFDANAGDDLVVAASNASQVHYLSGRAHTVGAGFDALAVSNLGLPGQPAGTPIITGVSAGALAAIGNFYASASPGVIDLALGQTTTSDSMFVRPGDGATAFADSIQITRTGSRPAGSVAAGFNPLGDLDHAGDIDGDGKTELCVGTRTGAPRDIMLFYADTFAASVSGGVAQGTPWLSVPITAASAGMELNVQYVGDFNADGSKDIAVGDPRVNSNQGQLFLLY